MFKLYTLCIFVIFVQKILLSLTKDAKVKTLSHKKQTNQKKNHTAVVTTSVIEPVCPPPPPPPTVLVSDGEEATSIRLSPTATSTDTNTVLFAALSARREKIRKQDAVVTAATAPRGGTQQPSSLPTVAMSVDSVEQLNERQKLIRSAVRVDERGWHFAKRPSSGVLTPQVSSPHDKAESPMPASHVPHLRHQSPAVQTLFSHSSSNSIQQSMEYITAKRIFERKPFFDPSSAEDPKKK